MGEYNGCVEAFKAVREFSTGMASMSCQVVRDQVLRGGRGSRLTTSGDVQDRRAKACLIGWADGRRVRVDESESVTRMAALDGVFKRYGRKDAPTPIQPRSGCVWGSSKTPGSSPRCEYCAGSRTF